METGLSLLSLICILLLFAVRCDWIRINRLEQRVAELEAAKDQSVERD